MVEVGSRFLKCQETAEKLCLGGKMARNEQACGRSKELGFVFFGFGVHFRKSRDHPREGGLGACDVFRTVFRYQSTRTMTPVSTIQVACKHTVSRITYSKYTLTRLDAQGPQNPLDVLVC